LKFEKIQNGVGHYVEKNRKIEKSPYLGLVLTDFDQIWHVDAVQPSSAVQPLKISNLKNPRWQWPPS